MTTPARFSPRKPNMRVVVPERGPIAGSMRASEELEIRSIVGGVLVQSTRSRSARRTRHGRRPICRS